MEIFNKNIEKYAILLYLIIMIPSIFIIGSNVQLLLASLLGSIGLIGITKMFKGKWNKIPSYISLGLSIILMLHLGTLKEDAELIETRLEIVETKNFCLIHLNGNNYLFEDKSEINFDKESPLRAYNLHKKDIFGFKCFETMAFKSELMDDYVKNN